MNPLALAILFLIIKPIIKGLTESNKQKQKWQKRQSNTRNFQTITPEPSQVEGKDIKLGDLLDYDSDVLMTDSDDNRTVPIIKDQQVEEICSKKRVVPEVYEPKSDSDYSDLLDEDNILRGIILKEVLSPPKFLR